MFKWVSALLKGGESEALEVVKSQRLEPTLTDEEEAAAKDTMTTLAGPWALGKAAPSADISAVREHVLMDLDALSRVCESNLDKGFVIRLAQTLAAQDLNLPQFPDVARELNEMMSDPRTDASRLARLVERDPSLVQRVWTQASSARYRRPPEGLHEAIARIGTSQLWRIAMRAAFDCAVFKVPQFQDEVEDVRLHGYVVAELASWMASEMRGPAYLSGLLHDVGKLIIFRSASEGSPGEGPSQEILEKVINDHHSSVGMLVCEAWGMDGAISLGVGFHHRPSEATELHGRVAWMVRVADILAHTAIHERSGKGAPGYIALSRIQGVNLDVDEAMKQAQQALDRFSAPTAAKRAS